MSPACWLPLELVYASFVRARNARFDRMAAQRLRWPVISIGNLSVGGAGKTPLVICLARLLEREGFRADVLSRGYGRSSQATERVDSAGMRRDLGMNLCSSHGQRESRSMSAPTGMRPACWRKPRPAEGAARSSAG